MPRVRLAYPRCGVEDEELSWLQPCSCAAVRTERMASRGSAADTDSTCRHFYGLDWTTIKVKAKRCLQLEHGFVDLGGVHVIAMHEFPIHKAYRYATVIVELSRNLKARTAAC